MLRSPAAALIILTLINLLNYVDRWILASVKPLIRDELHLSLTELGLISASFIWVYMLTSPIFGRLGDKKGRPALMAAGVGIWSLATAGAGMARGFASLFGARAMVGVGEAAYGSISPGVLADSFPKAKRGRVFAVFFAAIPIGSALGFIIGGLLGKAYGWRAAFLIAGLPGLLLALLLLLLRDPPRGEHDDPDAPGHAMPEGASAWAAAKSLMRIPAFKLTVLGYAAYTFGLSGLADIMPTFLSEVRGADLESANLTLGGITVVAGFLGTFFGGWLGDRLIAGGRKNGYLLVSGWAAAIAVPCSIVALCATDKTLYFPAFFFAELLLFMSTSPVNAVIVNVVPVNSRSQAVALSILVSHLLGDAISPPIIGALSDSFSLSTAVLIAPFALAVCAAVWIRGARHDAS